MGDEDDEPEFSSAMPLEEGDTFFFAPRPLRNLVLVDELDSLSPVLGIYKTTFCPNSYLYLLDETDNKTMNLERVNYVLSR